MDEKRHKQGLQDEIKSYAKLEKINQSEEFNDYFDLLLKTVADKMVWAFTTSTTTSADNKKKILVDNISSWDDFCKVRGEIIARLQPIQEVRGAKGMKEYLKKQLDEYYKEQ